MAEISWPWSTVTALGDGSAELGEEYSRWFLSLYFLIQDPTVEGVSHNVGGELEPSSSAQTIYVESGSGVSYGLYINTDQREFDIDVPVVGTTGGRVVLQTNWAGTGGVDLEARTRLAIIMNTDGNSAVPALTQTENVTWEISIARFSITTGGVISLTDDRSFRRTTCLIDADNDIEDAVGIYKIRQGAASPYQSNWLVPGTTNYDLNVPISIIVGLIEDVVYDASGSIAVTVPSAYGYGHVQVTCCDQNVGGGPPMALNVQWDSPTQFTIYWATYDGSDTTPYFYWMVYRNDEVES